MSTESEPEGPSISISGEDAAVIFRGDGQLEVYLPKVEEGSPVPPGSLMVLCVQEMVKDAELIQKLTEKLVENSIVKMG